MANPTIEIPEKVGFVGAGQMALAFARGIVRNHPQMHFVISDPAESSRHRFLNAIPQTTVVQTNEAVMRESSVVFLATKPQQLTAAFSGWEPVDGTLVISILAGPTIELLSRVTGQSHIVRVMPNTPGLIGRGVLAWCSSAAVSPEQAAIAVALLEGAGQVLRVDESQMDAVTGVSGSGPAYVYLMIEAMIAGGVEQGLDPEVARMLVIETLAGSTEMVRQTGLLPAELRQQVTSPGGTTLAGLNQLREHEFEQAIRKAIAAAAHRAKELGSPQ